MKNKENKENKEKIEEFEQSIANTIKYPFLWYKSKDDILYYLEKEVSHYFEEATSILSLIKDLDNEKVIGFELKTAKAILDRIEKGTINDGNVFKKNVKSNKSLFDDLKEFKK